MKHLLTLIIFLAALQLAGQQSRNFLSINDVRQYTDSLEKSLNSQDKEPSETIFIELANAYLMQQLTPKSFAYAIKAKELAVKNRNDSSLIAANIILANLYSNSNMTAKAEQTYAELIGSASLKKDKNLYLTVLLSRAFNLNRDKDSTPAEKAFDAYVKEAELNKDFEGLASAYYSKALFFYHEKRKFSQALEFYRKSLDILSAHPKDISNYNYLWHNCINNIGDLYELQKDYDSALNYYLQALAFYNNGKIRNRESYCINTISVATIYNYQGKYDQAEELLLKGLASSDSMRAKTVQYRVKSLLYNTLFTNYKSSGRQNDALKAVTAYQNYSDSLKMLDLVNAENSAVVNRLDNENMISKIEEEKELLEKRNQIKTLQLDKSKTNQNILIGFLIFIALIAMLIYSRYRMKMIANRNILTISKIGQDITSILEFEDLLYTFYEDSNLLMEVDAFGLGLINADQLIYKFFIDSSKRIPEFTDPLSLASSPAVNCIQSKKELYIADIENSEYAEYFSSKIPDRKIRSVIYLPLISKNKQLGVLTIQSYKKSAYIEQHINMLKTLASYLTIALDNSRIYSELSSLNNELKSSYALIKAEQEKSDQLLLNILPAKVAYELKEKGYSPPEVFEQVTVMFTDLVDFTKTSATLPPEKVIDELNDLFSNFDRIVKECSAVRIKTVGDAYLAVCGMPEYHSEHIEHIFAASVKIVNYLNERNRTQPVKWEIRIGIQTGSVVGGIVGVEKYIYDIFGDTVNVAYRMQQLSEPMRINVTAQIYDQLKDKYSFTPREIHSVKGKDDQIMYFWSGDQA